MVSLFSHRKLRRLPVFFLLDTSSGMVGTLEVTMQQGLLIVRHELSQHPLTKQRVHISGITFGGTTTFHYLTPITFFTPPVWQAQGQCNLKPALAHLVEAFTYDLIISRPERAGDYGPLVFLVLGSRPIDSWREEYNTLKTFTDNRRPLLVALVTQAELVQEMKAISQYVLLLDPVKGEYMTNFFYWVAQAIVKACEDCEQEASTIAFPGLPYGVVMPR